MIIEDSRDEKGCERGTMKDHRSVIVDYAKMPTKAFAEIPSPVVKKPSVSDADQLVLPRCFGAPFVHSLCQKRQAMMRS